MKKHPAQLKSQARILTRARVPVVSLLANEKKMWRLPW